MKIFEKNGFVKAKVKSSNENDPKAKADIEKFTQQLKEVINMDSLVNVFTVDSDEGVNDIELAILNTFLNCKNLFQFFQFQN